MPNNIGQMFHDCVLREEEDGCKQHKAVENRDLSVRVICMTIYLYKPLTSISKME